MPYASRLSVLDHEAAILHNFDSSAGEFFPRSVVSYSRLKPDGRRFFR